MRPFDRIWVLHLDAKTDMNLILLLKKNVFFFFKETGCCSCLPFWFQEHSFAFNKTKGTLDNYLWLKRPYPPVSQKNKSWNLHILHNILIHQKEIIQTLEQDNKKEREWGQTKVPEFPTLKSRERMMLTARAWLRQTREPRALPGSSPTLLEALSPTPRPSASPSRWDGDKGVICATGGGGTAGCTYICI